MNIAVFDIWGPYGHFRKAYAPLSPVTYPCPTPTAVCGMIGAILGLGKEEYLDRLNCGHFSIGIQMLNPVRKFRAAINLIKAESRSLGDFISTDVHDQIPYEFLQDPAFRIYFSHEDVALMDDLCAMLSSGSTAYTPVLGLAGCIASTSYVGCYQAQVDRNVEEVAVCTWVPAEAVVHYDLKRRYQRFRMPARMLTDRTVVRFDEVIVAEDIEPIKVEQTDAVRIEDKWICLL